MIECIVDKTTIPLVSKFHQDEKSGKTHARTRDLKDSTKIEYLRFAPKVIRMSIEARKLGRGHVKSKREEA